MIRASNLEETRDSTTFDYCIRRTSGRKMIITFVAFHNDERFLIRERERESTRNRVMDYNSPTLLVAITSQVVTFNWPIEDKMTAEL